MKQKLGINKTWFVKTFKIIKQWIGTIIQQVNECHVGAYASSAAFFTFLSLIPVLILFFAIIPYTPITEVSILKLVKDLLPSEIIPMANDLIHEMYHKKASVLSLSIIVTIWSSAKGIMSITNGLNAIDKHTKSQNYVFFRLRACLFTVMLISMIIILMVLVIFGKSIVKLSSKTFPQIMIIYSFVLSIRVFFLIVLLGLFIWAIYRWLPNRPKEKDKLKQAKRDRQIIYELPIAFCVSSIWYFASWLFSEYVNRYHAFGMYGSMATIAVIMFWLYMCFYIIFIGAILNSMIAKALIK